MSQFIGKNKKIYLLIVAILLSLVLTIVQKSFWLGAIGNFFKPKTLVEGLVGQPHLINPLYANLNPVDEFLSALVYRGLVKFNQTGLPEGDLAQNWEISEDGKEYLITLKNNLQFQDGYKLTSQDVAFTYWLTTLPEYQSPKKELFNQVIIETPNENQIKFILKEPYAPFLESLTLAVLPKHIWKDKNIEQILKSEENLLPVGSGILKVKKDSLRVNGAGSVQSLSFNILGSDLNQIRFNFYPNEESLIAAYQLGEVNSLTITNPNLAKELLSYPNLEVLQKYLNATQIVLLFNQNFQGEQRIQSLLLNASFRKLLASLIPTTILKGSSLGPIPGASWAYQSDLPQVEFNSQDVARELQDFNPPPLTLTLLQRPILSYLANEIKEKFEIAGLEIKLSILDSANFEEQVVKNKDFELLLLAQNIGVDPDQFTFWHSSQKDLPGLNLASFSSRRVDKALEEGRKVNDLDLRKKFYQEFQEEMIKELSVLFLTHSEVFYFYPKNLKIEVPENWWVAGDRFENLEEWEFE